MSVEVRLTSVLQKRAGGLKSVKAEGSSVAEILDHLDSQYPGFKGAVFTDGGDLHRFVNIYLNDEDIRYLDQLSTKVADGDVVAILPALAGGGT
jgi:MoaD family protein